MKRALTISIGTNVLLASVVLWMGRDEWRSIREQRNAAADTTLPHTNAAVSPIARSPEPFNWSQIESSDYRTYIVNLRRIGCPELTIRDIIVADVRNLYAHRREEVVIRGGKDAWSATRKAEMDAELAAQAREEEDLIQVLLGEDSRRTPVVERANAGPVRATRAGGAGVSQLPLVFRQPAEKLKLDEQESEVIDYLRQKFREELGPEGQDVSDPAYAQRWRRAQRNNDDLLAGLLGGEFYLNYQLETSE